MRTEMLALDFVPDDLLELAARLHRDDRRRVREWLDVAGHRELLATNGVAGSIACNGRLALCGGVLALNGHEAQLWSYALPDLPARVWLRVDREARRMMNAMRCERDIRRFEAEVAMDHAGAHRFIRRLGFRLEGVKCNANPAGQPMAVYGLTDPDDRLLLDPGVRAALDALGDIVMDRAA